MEVTVAVVDRFRFILRTEPVFAYFWQIHNRGGSNRNRVITKMKC